MTDTHPQLLDARELGRRLSIKANTLLSWARKGEIPHYRLGGLVRFSPEEVMEWVEKGRCN
jgi:excisionase family DNA binding protein